MRPLGSTGLTVSPVTLGGAPLGSMPENFGYKVAERDAIDAGRRDAGQPHPHHRHGERLLGRRERRSASAVPSPSAAGIPDDVLDHHEGRSRGTGTTAASRVRRSRRREHGAARDDAPAARASPRPGVPRLRRDHGPGGAVETLVEARERGGVWATSGSRAATSTRWRDTWISGVFEVLLVHNRWTLVDRSAEELIHEARRGRWPSSTPRSTAAGSSPARSGSRPTATVLRARRRWRAVAAMDRSGHPIRDAISRQRRSRRP